MSEEMARTEAIKTLKEHLSHWERLLQEHICEEQEGIDTISALKLAIASLETDEAYQLEYESTTKNDLGVDCISRQAVLVAMRNNYRDGGRDIDGDYIEGNYSEKLYDAIISLPPVTPQEPKWIPVSERLPEKTGIYLISIGDLVASKSFDGHNFRTESAVRFIPDAWMPLPKPYEPQESEE